MHRANRDRGLAGLCVGSRTPSRLFGKGAKEAKTPRIQIQNPPGIEDSKYRKLFAPCLLGAFPEESGRCA